MGILSDLLKKRGIAKVADLSQEEQETFKQYETVLGKTELTMADLREFLRFQIDTIEGKWKDLGMQSAQRADMLPLHTAYKLLLSAIDAPQVERARLEAHLRAMLNTPT